MCPICKQLHPPRWSTPRCPAPPPSRLCVCAGACSPTTRWSTTSCTTARCWRTHRQTAPVHRPVQHVTHTVQIACYTIYCWKGNLVDGPYETSCDLWIWALQIQLDWLIDWCGNLMEWLISNSPNETCASLPVSKVKVKETHCTVTDLLPHSQYELWVTATNTTGIGPASEKALYMTGNRWPPPPPTHTPPHGPVTAEVNDLWSTRPLTPSSRVSLHCVNTPASRDWWCWE